MAFTSRCWPMTLFQRGEVLGGGEGKGFRIAGPPQGLGLERMNGGHALCPFRGLPRRPGFSGHPVEKGLVAGGHR
jgi:hypothetical protein